MRTTAERFGINHQTVRNWLTRSKPFKPGPKQPHKMNMQALEKHINTHPDVYLHERAAHFGMSINGVWHAMKRLGVTKKNVDVQIK